MRGLFSMMAAGGAFLPTEIVWHALFWPGGPEFNALGLTNNQQVTSWPDEVTANALTKTASTNNRTYREADSRINGAPTVRFDGAAGSGMKDTSFTATGTTFSVVTVFHPAVAYSNFRQIINDGTTISGVALSHNSTLQAFSASGSPEYASAGVEETFGVVLKVTPSTDTMRLNGVQVVSDDVGNPGALTSIAVGSTYVGGAPLNGSVAFVGIYDGDITTDPLFSTLQQWSEENFGVTL